MITALVSGAVGFLVGYWVHGYQVIRELRRPVKEVRR